jgi:membrane associated rhomboid family serine protease
VVLGGVAIIAVAWVISLARGADAWAPTAEALLRNGGSGGEGGRAWWRLLTAWTVHAGAVHVGFNICLWMLVGPALERRAGPAITAMTIAGGAVTAAAVSRWWSPYVLTVGASGAAFAMAGGLVVRLVRGRGEPRRWAVAGLIGFAIVNLVAAVATPTVDHVAHVAGLAAGAVIGGVIEIRRVGPAIAAAVVVAVSIAATVTASTPRSVGATLEAIDRIEVHYRGLIAARAGRPAADRTADAALAGAIRRDVEQPLGALAEQLADDTAMPGRLRGRLAAARRYLDARREGLRLYVEYLETGDTALRNRIVETDHAVDAALELLRR